MADGLSWITQAGIVEVQIKLAFFLTIFKKDGIEQWLKTGSENLVHYYHLLVLCEFLQN